MLIVHLETSVQLALIASGCTLLGQIANIIASAHRAHRARLERAALSCKVEEHNAVVTEKLDVNTALTEKASANASQAYTEANQFNLKFAAIAASEEGVRKELNRLSYNIHAIANALTPVVGQISLRNRAEEEKHP